MEEKRSRILETAIELAEKGGFENVRLRDVAAFALAGYDCRFDRQQLAADFGPRESCDLTHAVEVLGLAVTAAPDA